MADTRAFGAPFLYVQGRGALSRLKDHLADYGDSLFCLIDPFLFEDMNRRLTEIFSADDGFRYEAHLFAGECSEGEAARCAALAQDSGCRVVAGIGGGKVLDTAKLAAARLDLPVFIIPTSASTDAPVSALSVVYTDTGAHLRSVSHKHSPELVLVDTEIIAKAPLRLFAAGVGDALSTYFEAMANEASDTANYIRSGYKRCKAGMALTKMCYDIILEEALSAKQALERGEITPAVEDVIEANILLSGLGFENTGCAGAHALHTGFHEFPETKSVYHGEIVAFGVLFQLALEKAPQSETEKIALFLIDMGLPVTLRQLKVAPTEENIEKIARRVLDGNSGIEAEPFHVTKDLVCAAIAAADALGQALLDRRGKR